MQATGKIAMALTLAASIVVVGALSKVFDHFFSNSESKHDLYPEPYIEYQKPVEEKPAFSVDLKDVYSDKELRDMGFRRYDEHCNCYERGDGYEDYRRGYEDGKSGNYESP